MNNMIELPTEADFHMTHIYEIREHFSGPYPGKECEAIIKRKASINMRNIVDYNELSASVNVLDEEKFPAWEEKRKAQQDLINENRNKFNKALRIGRGAVGPMGMAISSENSAEPSFASSVEQSMEMLPELDEVPMRVVIIKGVSILYFNGACRLLIDNFDEFQDVYFKYLQFQKLDIGK